MRNYGDGLSGYLSGFFARDKAAFPLGHFLIITPTIPPLVDLFAARGMPSTGKAGLGTDRSMIEE